MVTDLPQVRHYGAILRRMYMRHSRGLDVHFLKVHPHAPVHSVQAKHPMRDVPIPIEADGADYSCILEVLHLLINGRSGYQLAILNEVRDRCDQDHRGIIRLGCVLI
jgi:hypothetical protein